METLCTQVGDIVCCNVPKRGGSTIRWGATIRGNKVCKETLRERDEEMPR